MTDQPEAWRTDPRERLLAAIDNTWAYGTLGATPEDLVDDYARHLAAISVDALTEDSGTVHWADESTDTPPSPRLLDAVRQANEQAPPLAMRIVREIYQYIAHSDDDAVRTRETVLGIINGATEEPAP